MAPTLKDYRIYCDTEAMQVIGQTILDVPPTLCPNNPEHTVDAASKTTLMEYHNDNFTATVDPTVTDDVNAGYTTGSLWLNAVTREMFRCVDPSSGAAIWEPTMKAGGANDLTWNFGGVDHNYFLANNGGWESTVTFFFRGTNLVGTPKKFDVVAKKIAGENGVVRLRDITHNLTVASKGIDDTDISMFSDASMTNLPTGFALFEIQASKGAGNGVYLYSATLLW